MARSVLRLADQRAERFPDRCVLLGVPGLVPLLGVLPGNQRVPVLLPVHERVWRSWNRRNITALLFLVFGLGLIAASIFRATGDLLGLGVVVSLSAVAYRTRAHHNYWTTCRLNKPGDAVIVEPTHREFDRQAQRIFRRSFG